MSDSKSGQTGAEKVRWDLSCLYSGIGDPNIEADLAEFERGAREFREKYRGKLNELLGPALRDIVRLNCLADRISAYFHLLHSTDTGNEPAKTAMQAARERVAKSAGENLTFFELELNALDRSDVERQAAADKDVAHHLPFIRQASVFRPYQLSEDVESALAVRSSVGTSSWKSFFSEVSADLRVRVYGKEMTMTQAMHMLSNDRNVARRAKALAAIDGAYAGPFRKFSCQLLNVIARGKAIDGNERGYAHPMAERNLVNMIDDATVEALHAAVREYAAPLAQRHYRLKAKLLGLDRLAWSDRNAPLPISDDTVTSFDDARRMVLDAYRSFSPTLADLAERHFALNRVDAPTLPTKQGGAYNMSFCLPGGEPVSFVLLNYLGSSRDVMTLAHELGHGVHGLLAGETQGALMMHAPMAYAETASIFGEMVTFRHLTERHRASGNRGAALALLTDKCDDFANSVVRQIGFSEFERQVHGAGRRLSPQEMDGAWTRTTHALYGEPGDVFTYEHSERLWCGVPHFHSPFYVYAYAFGELLVQSLFAASARFGDRFEPLYLELLRAGGTKNAMELLAPFGLDPTSKEFWRDGIEVSMGRWVEEAERMAV